MKKVMIFGAGQAGAMVMKWLPADTELKAFIDNNTDKQGSFFCGVRVISVEQALSEGCDTVYISVVDPKAADEIQISLTEKGFSGRIIRINRDEKFMDIRLAALRLAASEIISSDISGDIAELGVYKGEFAKQMNTLFPDRKLYLFDTFEGFVDKDLEIEKEKAADGRNARAAAGDFGDTSIELVMSVMPYPDNVTVCRGYFPESLGSCPEAENGRYAVVSLDTDLYGPTYEGLRFFYPRLNDGGMILIHDYNSLQYPGVKRAVKDFAGQCRVRVVPLMDLHGTAVIIK